jgi:hypothetical protein
MHAPRRFADWMSNNVANDKKYGRKVFHYHPRSDAHSKQLCNLVVADLLELSELLSGHVRNRQVVGGINLKHTFPNGKKKNLDLAIGTPLGPTESESQDIQDDQLVRQKIDRLRIACEAKQCMTEHGKSQPRIFDELSSSHEIVHQGEPDAIAAGIVVVNIADRFASPTRQTSGVGPLDYTTHQQPRVTENMIEHLRGLVTRDAPGEVGFDALAIIVVECDNIGPCRLHTGHPAPQPGDAVHYEVFLQRIIEAYRDRYTSSDGP